MTHYYDKIGVAVVKITQGDLKIGDTVKFGQGDSSSTQQVTSMQIEHADIDIAKKGDEFGLKVETPVKDKTEIFKVK